MPRIKIDHIISFSSEDPEYPAAGLLSQDGAAGGRGWRCARPAAAAGQAASLAVQLARPARVASLTAGAFRAATIEVLVGRAESPCQWEVLVPSRVLLAPSEARRLPAGPGDGARVRAWGVSDLAAPASHQTWDRLRVVLTQPYNKHVQFGLSFIHVSEAEPPAPSEPVPVEPSGPLTLALPLPLDPGSGSDEEQFRPGELFAAARRARDGGGSGSGSGDSAAPLPLRHTTACSTTDAQIRKATSQVFKNIDHSASKLNRSLVKQLTTSKATAKDTSETHSKCDRPNNGSDRLDSKHRTSDNKSDKDDNKSGKDDSKNEKLDNSCERSDKKRKRSDNQGATSDNKHHRSGDKGHAASNKRAKPSNVQHSEDSNRDRSDRDSDRARRRESEGAGSSAERSRSRSRCTPSDRSELGAVLRGAVCVLSGYQGPERTRLRELARTLGAAVAPSWGPHATHLICAFPNTPKMREAVASRAGEAVPVPVCTGQWLQACRAARAALPWQWFATRPDLRVTPPDDWTAQPHSQPGTDRDRSASDEEVDTDDEIDRVLRAAPHCRSPAPHCRSPAPHCLSPAPHCRSPAPHCLSPAPHCRSPAPHCRSPDEPYGATTPPRRVVKAPSSIHSRALPPLLAGRVLAASPGLLAAPPGHALRRYVAAYGGTLLQEDSVSADVVPHYWLCDSREEGGTAGTAGTGGAVRVRADWLWRCHRARRLLPAPAVSTPNVQHTPQ